MPAYTRALRGTTTPLRCTLQSRRSGCRRRTRARGEVIAEEESAWDRATTILEELGFDWWAYFDETRRASLSCYYTTLEITPPSAASKLEE